MTEAKRMKKYRSEHREYCRALQRKYYKKNPKKSLLRVKRWRKKNPWAQRLRHIHGRCNNPKDIGFKYYGAKGIKCFLTRLDLKKLWFRDKAWRLKDPVVDRIKPKGNYIFTNCRFIERRTNFLRVMRSERAE